MCIAPSSPSPPPAPKAVVLPPAPTIEKSVATPQMQAGPAKPADPIIKRRGKSGMVIQMGSTAGTNVPGMGG